MKSRTSFFNAAVFRKDVTRFFPVWIIYSVILFIGFFESLPFMESAELAESIAWDISGSVVTSFFYAPLVCLLLFGDLYQNRLCNAIHALPVQRHTLFFSHTAAALCFYLVPNTLLALVQLLFLRSYWYVSLYWLLGTTLIYLCLLGIALFCIFCTGKRFAMAAVYCILLFFPLFGYGLYTTLYQPLLPGIRVDLDAFTRFSPVFNLSSHDYVEVSIQYSNVTQRVLSAQVETADWGYLWLWAGVGVAFGAAALLLYRRRHLESAGDFMAANALRPVFLVLYTLFMAMIFQLFGGMGTMFIGLILGFFTGLMLLNRTRKVFIPKAWKGLALLVGAIVITLILTAVDILGVTRWVPEAKDVKQVRLSSNTLVTIGDPFNMNDEQITLHDNQGISDAITLHKAGKDAHISYEERYVSLNIEYALKDGTVRRRYYEIEVDSPEGQLFEQYMSRPETLFGENPEAFLAGALIPELNGYSLSLEEQETVKELLLADCRAGYMAQDYGFHETYSQFHIVLKQNNGNFYINIYEMQSALYRWAAEQGYLEDTEIYK